MLHKLCPACEAPGHYVNDLWGEGFISAIVCSECAFLVASPSYGTTEADCWSLWDKRKENSDAGMASD